MPKSTVTNCHDSNLQVSESPTFIYRHTPIYKGVTVVNGDGSS